MNTVFKKIKSILDGCSESSLEFFSFFADESFYKHSVESDDYEKWRLIRFIFSEVLEFYVEDQPMEKVNWWIPFKYKKYECAVSHEKFGFRIYIQNSNKNVAENIGKELEKKFEKALKEVGPAIEQYARYSLEKGEIIVQNLFTTLYSPYIFFKNKTKTKSKPGTKNWYKNSREKLYFKQATYFFFLVYSSTSVFSFLLFEMYRKGKMLLNLQN